jgi:hypothetical protein
VYFRASIRACVSVVPPGANGTMMRTGFEGHACAHANDSGKTAAINAARKPGLLTIVSPLFNPFAGFCCSTSTVLLHNAQCEREFANFLLSVAPPDSPSSAQPACDPPTSHAPESTSSFRVRQSS